MSFRGFLAQEAPQGPRPRLPAIRTRAARKGGRQLPDRRNSVGHQCINERLSDDGTIGIAENIPHLFGGGDSEADAACGSTRPPEAFDEGTSGRVDIVPGTRDAHRGDSVHKATACSDSLCEALIGRTGRGEKHSVETRAIGGRDPLGCLLGNEIGSDEASPTRRDKIIGKPVDAVLKHEIPVRHDEHRGRDLLGDACDRGEDVRHSEASGEGLLRCPLDDRAIHDRIGVRQSQLEDIDTVFYERDGRINALIERGKPDGQVPDERATTLGSAAGNNGADCAGGGSHHEWCPSAVVSGWVGDTAPVGKAPTRVGGARGAAFDWTAASINRKYSAAVSMSLSPRPERLTRIVAVGPSSRPSCNAPASACADSIAGMIPSVRDNNRKALIAAASVTGR